MASVNVALSIFLIFQNFGLKEASNQANQILSQFNYQTIVPEVIYGRPLPGPRRTPAFKWSIRDETPRSDHYINRVLSNKRKETPINQSASQVNQTLINYQTLPNQTPRNETLKNQTPNFPQRPTPRKKRPAVMMNIGKSVNNATPRGDATIRATPRSIISLISPHSVIKVVPKPTNPKSVEIDASLIVLESRDNQEIRMPSNRGRNEQIIIRDANHGNKGGASDLDAKKDSVAKGDAEKETSVQSDGEFKSKCESSPNARVIILSVCLSLMAILSVMALSARYILRYKRKCEHQDEIVRAECVRVEGFGSHRLMYDPRV